MEKIKHENIESMKDQDDAETRNERELKTVLKDRIVELFAVVKERVDGTHREGGFDLKKRLNEITGPFIEVAGPTEGGYNLVDLDKLNNKVFTSNVFPGCPNFAQDHRTGDELLNYYGKVDFMADATELPFKDSTIGAIFISCHSGGDDLKDLSRKLGDRRFQKSAFESYRDHEEHLAKGVRFNKADLDREHRSERGGNKKESGHEEIIGEAFRVLNDRGLLVWQGCSKEILEYAKQIGFSAVLRSEKDQHLRKSAYRNIVFEKRLAAAIQEQNERNNAA